MKEIGQYAAAGVAAAIGGLFVSDFTGSLFNGMDFGSASVLGAVLYLCVIVVTCTGVIVSKLNENTHTGDAHRDE